MVTFWRNSLKVEKKLFEDLLSDAGIGYEIWDMLDIVYISTDIEAADLIGLEEYRKGWFYIQNLSSIMAVLALNPQPGDKILDIAAAPGGKTALMAVLMNNSGEIVANDLSKPRLVKMRRILRTLGVENVRFLNKPGEMVWRLYPNRFDKVLADVPCSMDDRVELTKKRLNSLVPRQRRLIWSAFTCLRIGGVMVYSTCTSTEEENEKIVGGLLESEKILASERESKRVLADELMGTFFYSVIEKK